MDTTGRGCRPSFTRRVLTFSLVAWQLRSGESMKPRPKTRMLRQLKARMSHSPPFSKSVNSTGWPNRTDIYLFISLYIHYFSS